MERHIDISRFDYDLPDERIAKFPLAERSASKLLVWRGGEIAEKRFADIGDVLPAGELLVFNNTKVIRARIVMHKLSGARIEVFCLEPHDPADYERAFAVTGGCTWSCIVGNRKKWKEGYVEINFERGGCAEHLRAWIVEDHGRECVVRFEWTAAMTFGQLLEYLGTDDGSLRTFHEKTLPQIAKALKCDGDYYDLLIAVLAHAAKELGIASERNMTDMELLQALLSQPEPPEAILPAQGSDTPAETEPEAADDTQAAAPKAAEEVAAKAAELSQDIEKHSNRLLGMIRPRRNRPGTAENAAPEADADVPEKV